MYCTVYVPKSKAPITAQLICVVFAYAKIRFSQNEAHINQSRTNGPINAHLTIAQV